MRFQLATTAACLLSATCMLHADEPSLFVPQWLGAQYTFVDQHQDSLHSPYSGPLSLHANGDTERSHTFGAYFGVPLPAHLQFYLDVEMFKGEGVSGATGLGGLTNGDVIRAGSNNLPKTPYVARAFLRWTQALGDGTTHVERAQDQLPGDEADERVEVKLGKMSVTDDFDKNRYAGSTRTQFMNWALFNNTAWDFAADTRGYTDGLVLALVRKTWSLRYGIYRMPYEANGQRLVNALGQSQNQQVELTLQPQSDGWALRFLAYRNTARMGIYSDALAIAEATGQPPDIHADDAPGRHKYGFGINGELPLADHGDTGLFMRAGWNDGHTESFVFTEVDRTMTAGFQLSGVHWSRPTDHVSVAVAVNGLSGDHRDYLAAGGNGFVLGDGALNYGREQILEAYYSFTPFAHFTLSPDLQLVHNPGYNRDRGPARFVGLRAHIDI
ncbi:carbohydrate porin [Dyella telluris]|uniref:Carbohydrate porin n=1 Tax=Dyella telluris TaxID=2763498 RepID=A0A7G8Q5F8_9GAMM|nr:carbohydrate porin [Dyella telluris]QNK02016.1 carbohydrate porin [Dyella telluris]